MTLTDQLEAGRAKRAGQECCPVKEEEEREKETKMGEGDQEQERRKKETGL